eukprot:4258383-Alexandrium_andersonii.AAC.1
MEPNTTGAEPTELSMSLQMVGFLFGTSPSSFGGEWRNLRWDPSACPAGPWYVGRGVTYSTSA